MKLARYWEMSCESLKEKKDTTEGPRKFDNTDYEKWRKSLMNQLESMLWGNDVPLTYVVLPMDDTNESELFAVLFLSRTVLQALVEGKTFEGDSCTVHQLIVYATTGTEVEYFLLLFASSECGRCDMKLLTEFFKGTGNNNLYNGLAEAALKHLEYRSDEIITPEMVLYHGSQTSSLQALVLRLSIYF